MTIFEIMTIKHDNFERVTFSNLFVAIDNSSIPIFSIRKFTRDREEQHPMCDDAILLGLSMYKCLNEFKL